MDQDLGTAGGWEPAGRLDGRTGAAFLNRSPASGLRWQVTPIWRRFLCSPPFTQDREALTGIFPRGRGVQGQGGHRKGGLQKALWSGGRREKGSPKWRVGTVTFDQI